MKKIKLTSIFVVALLLIIPILTSCGSSQQHEQIKMKNYLQEYNEKDSVYIQPDLFSSVMRYEVNEPDKVSELIAMFSSLDFGISDEVKKYADIKDLPYAYKVYFGEADIAGVTFVVGKHGNVYAFEGDSVYEAKSKIELSVIKSYCKL